jgi:spermidine synthase/MFS family permease
MAANALLPKETLVQDGIWPYFLLFFVSGFPALLYQTVWQRALFTIYGVNVESVTVIVTVFMLGLGLGSLAGGKLSAIGSIRTLRAFGLIEISIGAFGLCSLPLFHWVAEFTAGASIAGTGAVTFALLLIPTLLMGSTLPLMVEYLVKRTENVGESVGSLYSANTFGSGVACLLAAIFLMRILGESGSVRLAACLNFAVGTTALLISRFGKQVPHLQTQEADPSEYPPHQTIPFPAAMLLAGSTGFIALAYEIIWYRLYSYVSGGRAPCFANLLAYYLIGVAYGALAVHDECKKKLKKDLSRTLSAGASVVLIGSISAYLLGPALSFACLRIPYEYMYGLVAVASALLGASFPILSHAAIGPEGESGKKLSYLYLSNIVGSALGSFLVGFVILDHLTTSATSLILLGLGALVAALFALGARPRPSRMAVLGGCVACVAVAALSGWLYSGMYERLLYKDIYNPGMHFANVVENRSGVIAVDSHETVYGGGAYDGHFNTDPVNDTNMIFRCFAIPAIHPNPKDVLIIGLSSGSWAQIVANDPQVQKVTIIEINPGYLPLISERASVASLLKNPKVHIVIDDGRRWLVAHPERRFDFVLMNTTFYWRANISNLLSVEFLQLIRKHLKPGGVHYYNTTFSEEALLTGATVFPHALRIANFLAVSDSPIVFNREKLRSALMTYRIDDRPVFDMTKAEDRTALERIVMMPDLTTEKPGHEMESPLERRESVLRRIKAKRLITDDNMGTEWP